VKAINLKDFDLLYRLGASGLKIDGFSELQKSMEYVLKNVEFIEPDYIKTQIDVYLESKRDKVITLQRVQDPVNLNFSVTGDGITPLMMACTQGDLDIVKLMLCNPTLDIDRVDASGINALYVCAYYGHTEIFKLLRENGAQYVVPAKGTTVLHVVCKKGFHDILKFLLHEPKDHRIPIDSEKSNGMTPAMLAVIKNHLLILRMLREAGASMHKSLEGGVNLLYLAAQFGHAEIVGYLLDK
jgi:ankyrin repeat protein